MTPDDADVADRLRAIVQKILALPPEDLGKLTPEAPLPSLGADSLDLVEIAIAVEETFDIAIPEADVKKLVTLGDAVAYVRARRSGSPGATTAPTAPPAGGPPA